MEINGKAYDENAPQIRASCDWIQISPNLIKVFFVMDGHAVAQIDFSFANPRVASLVGSSLFPHFIKSIFGSSSGLVVAPGTVLDNLPPLKG
jgi:hypothetical protein